LLLRQADGTAKREKRKKTKEVDTHHFLCSPMHQLGVHRAMRSGMVAARSHLSTSAGALRCSIVALPRASAASLQTAGQPRVMSSFTDARLEKLQMEADAAPRDALKQHRYLKALLRAQPVAVLRRVQSGQFANNAAIQQLCDEARGIMRAGADRVDTMHPQQTPLQQGGAIHPASILPNGLGSPQHPLIVADAPYTRIPVRESIIHAFGRAVVFASLLTGCYMLWVSQGKPNLLSAMGDLGSKKSDFLSRTMSNVRFNDVKGCDEAKAELQEVVEYLKNPSKFERLGGRMTKGLLLTGPPGTGQQSHAHTHAERNA
jgi:ATP-dependent metalloprotease